MHSTSNRWLQAGSVDDKKGWDSTLVDSTLGSINQVPGDVFGFGVAWVLAFSQNLQGWAITGAHMHGRFYQALDQVCPEVCAAPGFESGSRLSDAALALASRELAPLTASKFTSDHTIPELIYLGCQTQLSAVGGGELAGTLAFTLKMAVVVAEHTRHATCTQLHSEPERSLLLPFPGPKISAHAEDHPRVRYGTLAPRESLGCKLKPHGRLPHSSMRLGRLGLPSSVAITKIELYTDSGLL